jgi:hypothetical protein
MKTIKAHYYILLGIFLSFALLLSSSGEIRNTAVPTQTATNQTLIVPTPTPTPSQPVQPQPVSPSFSVILVDQDAQAKNRAVSVHATLSGISLVEPGGVASAGQGHLHYQLDDHPPVATTATDVSFHHLSSGAHKIVISLAGNDHTPLGPTQTLTFQIP